MLIDQYFSSETFRVVGFEVETHSIDHRQYSFEEIKGGQGWQCSFQNQPKQQLVNPRGGTQLYFTYSVEWHPSPISWASRWDIYLRMSDVQIHWFSIVNSLVVVFFLSGIIIIHDCL